MELARVSLLSTRPLASSSEEKKKMVTLKAEEKKFEVEEEVAKLMETIGTYLVEEECKDDSREFTIPNVTASVLAMVIEYCKRRHAAISSSDDEKKKEEEFKKWVADFVEKLDYSEFFGLVRAAHFLEVGDLLNILTKTVANRIKGKSVEEVRDVFNIKNDYNEEEDEGMRKKHAWALE